MVDIGIVEIIGLGAPLGIIGTMFIVLYFSRKQAQGFNLDIETKVLNDLDVTELNIVKNNVTKYPGTIEDYLKEKGFKEVHFHDSGTLPKHAHYRNKRGCSFR